MAEEMKRRSTLTSVLEAPHTETVEKVLQHYDVTLEAGLDSETAIIRLSHFGPNVLQQQSKESLVSLFLEQFDDMLVKILLTAAVISFGLTLTEIENDYTIYDFIEPLVILVILFLNALVGVWQEASAEQALDALKKLQPTLASCLRDGKWTTIDSSELVVGDIVRVRTGNKIPADLRVCTISSTSLSCEQSQLTGESVNVAKTSQALPARLKACELQEKKNILYCGTTVTSGNCVGVVIATGMSTEIGIIQTAVLDAHSQERETPLQKMLNEFSTSLSKFISLICIAVWIINFRKFNDPIHGSVFKGSIYYFKIAIALAVAAIPEGLPAVITTSLALGTRNMAKRNAIVRRLPSVETLGCTTVICSDKTGTLTTNKMCALVLKLFVDSGKMDTIHFSTSDDSMTHQLVCSTAESSKEAPYSGPMDKLMETVSRCGAMCSDASVEQNEGEPTELAILQMVDRLHRHLLKDKTKTISAFYQKNIKKLATLEFCRDRKMMSVIAEEDDIRVYAKGAPEAIVERCTHFMMPDGKVVALNDGIKNFIMKEVEGMAKDALRTIAFAFSVKGKDALTLYREKTATGEISEGSPKFFAQIEKDLIFLGVSGIVDPPRPQVKNAIRLAKQAGIRVFMITGDNKLTAEAISKNVGILPADFPNTKSGKNYYSLTGKDFEALSEEKRKLILSGDGVVFSRTESKHKQYIVAILKQMGETVAMTGDGVNDAPALKMADIGVSMGITGTEVAKEASDMILVDDNFQSIVAAIEEGRCIYSNMKAFIRYLISSNIGEVASIFLTAALGIPEGMIPVKLLWVNLVTDGLPATALSFNPPDPNVMVKQPRSKEDRLIDGWTFVRYLVIGMYVGVSTVGIFIWWYVRGISPDDKNTLVSLHQLMNFSQCKVWKGFQVNRVHGMTEDMCSYFTLGKVKPATLSLTVLVIIEMFNAFNAVSEDSSLLVTPPWCNPHLILATTLSLVIHCVILYNPFLAKIFDVVPLDQHDWIAVLLWSFPVIIIDEILKVIGRMRLRRAERRQEGHQKSMEAKKKD